MMQPSPITVTYSLEEVLTRLEGKIDNLQKDVNEMKGELTGINKRLDNLEFTNRTIFVAIVVALLTGLVKIFFPNWTVSP